MLGTLGQVRRVPARGGEGNDSMRIDKRSNPASVGVWTVILAAALVSAGTSIKAASGPPNLVDLLAGNTLSAVTWVPRSAATSAGGTLSRFMLQAYLRPDGSASIRVWDAARNAFTKPVERNWTVSGSRLCLELPNPAPARICAEVHSWGPRIAGVGTAPYVMLDGDLRPGNAILGTR